MWERTVRACWFVGVVGSVLLVGCARGGRSGPPPVKMAGRVVENGQPVTIQNFNLGYNCLQLEFYPVDAAGKPMNAPHSGAFVAEDGTFSISDLPAGKYRAAVRRWDRTRTILPDPSGNIDAWEGKFSDKNSPFIVDVSGPRNDIVIDLAKAPAKK